MSKEIKDNSPIMPTYDQTGDLVLKNQDTLRKLVGILGMLLPVLLYLFLQLDSNFSNILPSISHYYFTRVGSIFLIIVSLLAVFLLIYKGEARKDFYLSSVAGFFALLLLLFPTNNLSAVAHGKFLNVCVTSLRDSGDFRMRFHYFSAAVFLSCLAGMAFFQFTKSSQPPSKRTKRKKLRNRIYRTCAILMAVSILVMFLGLLKVIPDVYFNEYSLTFWMEVLALEAFGFSWLIKGKSFFTDKE